ncbi:MAG: hypothetical protein ABEI07_01745, partial [Candidatus Nanohaloarchaea archaeon]
AWMQSLNYMDDQTEPGSVIMSWWDYGYWFESIGRRPAVADGGNAGYYTDQRFGKTNYPLADYFTATSPNKTQNLFRKHSVDYIVLDNSMIGKYSAVSQISNRDNSQFKSMLTLSSRRSVRKARNGILAFSSGRLGISVLAPIKRTGGGVEFSTSKPAILETSRGRIPIGCVLTEEGIKHIENVSRAASYCIAEDPFRSLDRSLKTGGRAKLIMVPRSIARANLVRLYLMDGHGIPYVEKIPEASNGYVKMWKVDFE